MKQAIPILLAIGAVLLVGCGAAGPDLATSIEDVVGTWTGPEGGFFIIHEDATLTCSPTLTGARGPFSNCDATVWFEGNEFHLIDEKDCADMEGIYQIQLLENGNIQFVLVEDDETCSERINFLTGEDGEGVEMSPVVQ